MKQPRILLVGAGAVGQVYGYHLHRGGAEVAFFVKAKYREGLAQAGMPLYPLKGRDKGKRIDFKDFGLVSTPEEAAAQGPYDQVWLCMSSTALKGAWLDALLAVLGDATLVSLQPGIEDGDYLRDRLRAAAGASQRDPAERLVQGLIPMISYQAPLPGEHRDPPGVAYYWPPARNPFSGAPARVGVVVEALNRGGWRSKAVPDVTRTTAVGSACMVPAIAGLEVGDWRFATFGRGEGVRLARAAIRQTVRIATGGRMPLGPRLLATGFGLRATLFLGARLLPLPLEVYLKYHFTKVGDQTRAQLRTFIERGRAAGLPTDAIEALLARLSPQA